MELPANYVPEDQNTSSMKVHNIFTPAIIQK